MLGNWLDNNGILQKLVLIVSAVILTGAAWWLWSYDDSTVVDTTNSESQVSDSQSRLAVGDSSAQEVGTTTDTAQTPTDATQAVPAAGFPFSIDGKDSAEDFTKEEIQSGGATYTYALSGEATIRIDIGATVPRPTDFNWQYTMTESGAITLPDTSTVFCAPASEACSLGNGVMEVTIVPADAGDEVRFYVTDTTVDEFTVVAKYKPIIETFVLNKQAEGASDAQ